MASGRRQHALYLSVHGLGIQNGNGPGVGPAHGRSFNDPRSRVASSPDVWRQPPAARNVIGGSTPDCRSLSRSVGLCWLLALARVSSRAGSGSAPHDPALLVAKRHARLVLVHAVGGVISGVERLAGICARSFDDRVLRRQSAAGRNRQRAARDPDRHSCSCPGQHRKCCGMATMVRGNPVLAMAPGVGPGSAAYCALKFPPVAGTLK